MADHELHESEASEASVYVLINRKEFSTAW